MNLDDFKANARLITAAPDLLAQLDALTEERNTLRVRVDQLNALFAQAASERDTLRAALQGLMKHYVGERSSQNVVGEAGIAADKARAALTPGH